MLRHIDLFSGIGGFALAARMVGGYETVAFCEIEPYCQAVLRKHWPGVPIYDDVRAITKSTFTQESRYSEGGFVIDIITGGFPCQDISVAGKGAGIDGERSGLWREYARLIGETRPRYVLMENVSALLSRGLGEILGELAALGYDAEWHCVPASYVGAPHRRDRIWIVAYANSGACELRREPGNIHGAHSGIEGARTRTVGESVLSPRDGSPDVADTGRDTTERYETSEWASGKRDWWLTEPDVDRVAHGVPSRVDRLRSLGNAIVPQVAAIFLQAIKECATGERCSVNA